MITSKSLRWSGAAISNGRQRLAASPQGARFYSFTSSRASVLKSHTTRSRQHTISGPSVEQFRSISFWGWGSSKPNDADFAKVHTPDASSVPDSTLGHDGQVITQRVTPSSQSIPAVHQTSDSPSSASFVPDPGPTPFNVDASPLDQLTTPDEIPLADALDPAEALSAIPERIGYLKEVCGIDFGWGSSSMMQMLLEHIHIYGGFTWATSVVLLAVVARVVIFFPMARSSDMGAKWKATQPIIGPVRERLQEAYRAQDHAKMAEAKAEMKALNQEYGIAPMKMFLPVLIQVPLQFGGFRVLRNMAELPVPALVKEHWLWAQDLTLGDPFYILPVANAAILYLTIKRGGEMGTTQLQGGLMVTLSYIMPAFSFLFMTFQPGAVQLYFFTSAFLALVQSRLLTNNSFRNLMGLHPTVPTPKKPTPAPSSGGNNTTPATTTPGFGPGELKLYQPPPPTSTLPADAKVRDIGMIDKFVDNAKSRKNEAMDGWYSVMGTTKEKTVLSAERDKIKRQAEEYERRMAREAEEAREERNRLKMRQGSFAKTEDGKARRWGGKSAEETTSERRMIVKMRKEKRQ